MKLTYSLFLIIIFAFLMACSDKKDSNGPSASDLQGKWKLTKYEYQSKANSNLKHDIIGQGIDLEMTVDSDGDFTMSGTYLGFPFSYSGQMDESDSGIEVDDPNTTVTLSGKNLTIVSDDEEWDFGNGDEPAILTQVFEKQ